MIVGRPDLIERESRTPTKTSHSHIALQPFNEEGALRCVRGGAKMDDRAAMHWMSSLARTNESHRERIVQALQIVPAHRQHLEAAQAFARSLEARA